MFSFTAKSDVSGLRKLEKQLQQNIQRKAVRAAANIAKAAVKASLPVRTGQSVKSISVKVSARNGVKAIIGSRRVKRAKGPTGFYSLIKHLTTKKAPVSRSVGSIQHILERGNKQGVEGGHYVEKAFTSCKTQMDNTMIEVLRKEVEAL